MRRKSFYVVAVDVYMSGLSLSPAVAKMVKQAPSNKTADIVLSTTPSSPHPNCAMCVTMHFVRDVTTAQAVDAFKDAFKGCNPEGIATFGEMMTSAIGNDGCKVDEEVSFYWLEGGGLFIDKNGTKPYCVRNPEIEKRLIDVYLDPARTVAPDLLKSFDDYLRS